MFVPLSSFPEHGFWHPQSLLLYWRSPKLKRLPDNHRSVVFKPFSASLLRNSLAPINPLVTVTLILTSAQIPEEICWCNLWAHSSSQPNGHLTLFQPPVEILCQDTWNIPLCLCHDYKEVMIPELSKTKHKQNMFVWACVFYTHCRTFKITRTFTYDLNQITYDYTVEVTSRCKELDLIHIVLKELWMEAHNIIQEECTKTIPKKKKCKKAKQMSEEALK